MDDEPMSQQNDEPNDGPINDPQSEGEQSNGFFDIEAIRAQQQRDMERHAEEMAQQAMQYQGAYQRSSGGVAGQQDNTENRSYIDFAHRPTSSSYDFSDIFTDDTESDNSNNPELENMEPLNKKDLFKVMDNRLNKDLRTTKSLFHHHIRPSWPYTMEHSAVQNRPFTILPFKIQDFVPLSSVMNKAFNHGPSSIGHAFNYAIRRIGSDYRKQLANKNMELLFAGPNMDVNGREIISTRNPTTHDIIQLGTLKSEFSTVLKANHKKFTTLLAYYAQKSKETMMTHGFIAAMIDFHGLTGAADRLAQSWTSRRTTTFAGKKTVSFSDGNFYTKDGKLIASLFITKKKYEQLLHNVYSIYSPVRGTAEYVARNVPLSAKEVFLIVEEEYADVFVNYDYHNPAIQFFLTNKMIPGYGDGDRINKDNVRPYFNFALTKDIIRFITGQQVKVRKAYEAA